MILLTVSVVFCIRFLLSSLSQVHEQHIFCGDFETNSFPQFAHFFIPSPHNKAANNFFIRCSHKHAHADESSENEKS